MATWCLIALIGLEIFNPAQSNKILESIAHGTSGYLAENLEREVFAQIYLYDLMVKTYKYERFEKLSEALTVRKKMLDYLYWAKSQQFRRTQFFDVDEEIVEITFEIASLHLQQHQWELAKNLFQECLALALEIEAPSGYLVTYFLKPAQEVLSKLSALEDGGRYKLEGSFSFVGDGDVPNIVPVSP